MDDEAKSDLRRGTFVLSFYLCAFASSRCVRGQVVTLILSMQEPISHMAATD
jgi:hypothetical protein